MISALCISVSYGTQRVLLSLAFSVFAFFLIFLRLRLTSLFVLFMVRSQLKSAGNDDTE